MPDLTETITGFVAGDDLQLDRTITSLPAAIVKAWLTVKRYSEELDAAAVFRKIITTGDVPGTGHVVTAGGIGVDGVLRFDLTQANTRALGVRTWVYDIQIKTADDTVYTVEKGTITQTGDVTKDIA